MKREKEKNSNEIGRKTKISTNLNELFFCIEKLINF